MIDGCIHSFAHLATAVLPAHMQRLRAAMAAPHPMATFAIKGNERTAAIRQLGYGKDFPGCYVLIDVRKPLYVGISRRVLARLIQHATGRTHYDASLAYRIASARFPHTMRRGDAMKHPEFLQTFLDAQAYIKSLSVAFVKIDCPVELYTFEVFASMALDTSDWNTFRTH